ncbi:hypothetical protein THIX_60570 [Thiomonas sp. X19]|nr:hypothetical protein THIX_60570 [Thiomonas sp. X19]
MMNRWEKSDLAIVATKPANKAGRPAAEWAEPRAGAEGNTGHSHTRRTQSRGSVSQGLDRVRRAAKQRKKERFTAVLHHVTVDLLTDAFLALKRWAAPGVDGATWQDYEANLEEMTFEVFTAESMVARTGRSPSGDGSFRRLMASSDHWGSPPWKTKSSSERWSRYSRRSTKKTSSDSRMGSGPAAVSTMPLMPWQLGFALRV